MADLKISQLVDGGTVLTTDQIPVNRGGVNRRVVVGSLATQDGTFSGTSSGTNTGDQTSVTGNAGTATALQTARNINGVAFDGTANITVTAAAGTLSGSTLASGVTSAPGVVTAAALTTVAGGTFGTAAFTAASAYDAAGAAASAQSASQPVDSDLTAIAALTTTTYGRSLLTLADAAAGRTSLGLVIGTNVQAWDTDLDTWSGKTAPSGVVLGTTDSQTLTNKSIDAGQLTGSVAAARLPALTGPVTTSAGTIATTLVFEKQLACSDTSTALTTGTKKARFCWPFTGTLTEVIIDVDTAPTGSTLIVDVKKNGTTIFSTKVTIDATETSSLTAAVAAVISVTSFTKGDIYTINIDQVGSTIAGTWLIATFIGTRS